MEHNGSHSGHDSGVPGRYVMDEAAGPTALRAPSGSSAPHSPRRRVARRLALLLGLITLLAAPVQPVAADVGPKPQMVVRVTYEGRPVPDAAFQARVLACVGDDAQFTGQTEPLPGLDQVELVDPTGCRWEPSLLVWGGDCTDGQCHFGYMLPPRFRLAVYLPSQGRLFITDAAERQGFYDSFGLDLSADGTGRLRPAAGLAHTWTTRGILVALALTLVIETAVILLYTRRKRWPRRRLLVTGLVANVLTLPGVWLVAGLAAAIGGPQAGLAALALLELGAWAVEGAAYATLGRLSVGTALLLSLIANGASLGLGLLIH